MSHSQFRLESFRAWNPPDSLRPSHSTHSLRPASVKAPSSYTPPNPRRCPPPTSITGLPITPDPSPHPSRSPSRPARRPHHHPLPARPPDEVCTDRGSRSRRHRTHSRSRSHSSSENALCPTPAPDDRIQRSHSPLWNPDRTSVESHDDHRGSSMQDRGQDEDDTQINEIITAPSTAVLGNADGSEEICLNSMDNLFNACMEPRGLDLSSIDPAILSVDAASESPSMSQAFFHDSQVASEGRRTAAFTPDPLAVEPYPPCPTPKLHRTVHENQQASYDVGHDDDNGQRDGPMLEKRSSSTELLAERGAKRRRTDSPFNGDDQASFVALRSQFSSSPFEECLQFLSWLFEATLPRCMSESATLCNAPLTSRKSNKPRKKPTGASARFRYITAPKASGSIKRSPVPSRRGKPWSTEEVDLLVSLRRGQNLPWSQVVEKFGQQYPGRTRGAIQVFWSTKAQARH